MAYQVTKTIHGRDYRYVVESYRDPETNRRKRRWHYAGAVDGESLREPVTRRRRGRVTRDDIVNATARLLGFRDPERITVAVIATAAGTSQSTFYRFFATHHEALDAATVQLIDALCRELPLLDSAPASLESARAQLRRWCESVHATLSNRRIFLLLMTRTSSGKPRARFDRSRLHEDAGGKLTAFFEGLSRANLAEIDDPRRLAQSVSGSFVALRAASIVKPAADLTLPAFEDVYYLIERAVFRS